MIFYTYVYFIMIKKSATMIERGLSIFQRYLFQSGLCYNLFSMFNWLSWQDCVIQCKYPTYGEGCQSVCNCLINECHFSLGCILHTTTDREYEQTSMFYVHYISCNCNELCFSFNLFNNTLSCELNSFSRKSK